jgi:hypothetical protein
MSVWHHHYLCTFQSYLCYDIIILCVHFRATVWYHHFLVYIQDYLCDIIILCVHFRATCVTSSFCVYISGLLVWHHQSVCTFRSYLCDIISLCVHFIATCVTSSVCMYISELIAAIFVRVTMTMKRHHGNCEFTCPHSRVGHFRDDIVCMSHHSLYNFHVTWVPPCYAW